MFAKKGAALFACVPLFLLLGCASNIPKALVTPASVQPGSHVTLRGSMVRLIGSPIAVGNPLPSVELVDAKTMRDVNLSKDRGAVLLLSIVPSIDTPVCEEQTHYLGEQGKRLPGTIRRTVISRDTPYAQMRFAREAKLTHLYYLSDYKQGNFGRSLGLLAEGSMLLARSVIVVDKNGVVRYLQVVPEMTHLPDMEKAFGIAATLASE